MGDYDFKPSGTLKLKGVKDKKIKKPKKEHKPKKESSPATEKQEESEVEKPAAYVVPKTEAERRFEEIQRQRVYPSEHYNLNVCGY